MDVILVGRRWVNVKCGSWWILLREAKKRRDNREWLARRHVSLFTEGCQGRPLNKGPEVEGQTMLIFGGQEYFRPREQKEKYVWHHWRAARRPGEHRARGWQGQRGGGGPVRCRSPLETHTWHCRLWGGRGRCWRVLSKAMNDLTILSNPLTNKIKYQTS